MEKQTQSSEWWLDYIEPILTRQGICSIYGLSYKVFEHQIEIYKIELPSSGPLLPKHQINVFETLGPPASHFKKDRKDKKS